MKIYDLTRGRYPNVYFPTDESYYAERLELMLSDEFKSLFEKSSVDVSKLLNIIPVFLVESSMSEEYVAVPGCQCLIRVPADQYASFSDNEDFDIDNWANSKESGKDDPRERISKSFSITDLLGVYVYTDEHDIIPRRIFIWVDKIMDYAKNKTKIQSEIIKNAQHLFDLVLYHEMAHALMDVELYGVHPAPNFSYNNDYPYRFIEEAYANGIALIFLEKNHIFINWQEKEFIKQFVINQGAGYSEGWEIYELVVDDTINDVGIYISQWMALKFHFNYELALRLKDWWEVREFDDLLFF